MDNITLPPPEGGGNGNSAHPHSPADTAPLAAAGAADAPPVATTRPALNPLRDGDGIEASGSHFGHFLHFVTAPLREGETRTVELRLLQSPQVFGKPPKVYGTAKTKSGYFVLSQDQATWHRLWDEVKAVLALGELGRPKAVCITLNPVLPDLRALANRKLVPVGGEGATADKHVVARHLLLIDIDPVRRAGGVVLSDVPATDAERATAHELADIIKADLTARGWPEPLSTDSGNGGGLLYHIDLPADDGGLVERVLKALAGRYNNDAAKVDVMVHNAARLTRVPGSWNAKADDSPELGRRHRMARIRTEPAAIGVVTREQLESLIADIQSPPTPPAARGSPAIPTKSATGPAAKRPVRGKRGRGTASPRERADRYFRKVPGATAGERNSRLYAVAARLIGSYDVPVSDVVGAAQAVWAPKCSPPLGADEVEKIVGNAAAYNRGLPSPAGDEPHDPCPPPAGEDSGDGGHGNGLPPEVISSPWRGGAGLSSGKTNPHRLARLYLATTDTPKRNTLRFYRDEFLRWCDGAYRAVPDEEFRAEVTAFLEREMERLYRCEQGEGGDDEDDEKEDKGAEPVTIGLVNNVTNAIKSLVLLPSDIEAPRWVDGATGPDPRTLLVLKNGILNVDDAADGRPGCLAPPNPSFFTRIALP